jgi:hypothetical protein
MAVYVYLHEMVIGLNTQRSVMLDKGFREQAFWATL